MQLVSIIPDFQPMNDERLLKKAASLTPELIRTLHPMPEKCFLNGDEISFDALSKRPLRRGDRALIDFGCHMVGYLTLSLGHHGSHQDAPAYIRADFAEVPGELEEDPEKYDGWLSRSWIQREHIHLDILPARVSLPRRYAFRYVRVTVLDTSPKYQLLLKEAACEAVSAVSPDQAALPKVKDDELARIFRAALNTLKDCSQEVLEDGPKRDRRLWLGDLRLQALAMYASFRHYGLVKRCLYLFAGSRFPDGRMSACVFTDGEPAADDTYLMDYALQAPMALEEYLEATDDREALDDLLEPSLAQADIVLERYLTSEGIISGEGAAAGFIDWSDDLDRRASLQGVLIMALDACATLCCRAGDAARADKYAEKARELRKAALKCFWSEKEGCFVSGGQVSVHSQVYMILAGVMPAEKAARAVKKALDGGVRMNTPYMHHYYVTALLLSGQPAGAERHLREYWGGMIAAGDDTFREYWDPADPDGSPYGGRIVNSYCHAWSCSPVHVISRYLS